MLRDVRIELLDDKSGHRSCLDRCKGGLGVPTVRTRRVTDADGLLRLAAARRRAFLAEGVVVDDRPYVEVRRLATNLAFDLHGEVGGGVSFWRVSEAPCTLGHLLTGIDIEHGNPERIAEVGLLFVASRFRGLGLSRLLFGDAIELLAQSSIDWIVTFAVRREVARYVRLFGFREVGVPTAHPLSPSIDVVPLAARRSRVVAMWQRQRGIESVGVTTATFADDSGGKSPCDACASGADR